MKFGIRRPNLKSRLRARTTGKLKRKVNRSLIPFYGRRGMGWVKNPRKAAYGWAYRRTTASVDDVAKALVGGKRRGRGKAKPSALDRLLGTARPAGMVGDERQALVALLLCVFLGLAGAHRFYLRDWGVGTLYLLTAGFFAIGWVLDIVSLARIYAAVRGAGQDG